MKLARCDNSPQLSQIVTDVCSKVVDVRKRCITKMIAGIL